MASAFTRASWRECCHDCHVAEFVVPERLAESVRADACSARRQWVGRLPDTVAKFAQLWSLRLGAPYEPGGGCSWVAPVRNADGQRLVLKVAWRHDEAESEADGLHTWNGRGAVLLQDAQVEADTSALLLERCEPGTTLGSSVPEPKQDIVIAGLLQRLWSVEPTGGSFRSLQIMCDAWASEFEQRLSTVSAPLDPGLTRAGIELLRSLPASARQTMLLATDLHAGNVLASRRERWLVIDPKPYLGDPAYDCVQHMLNCDNRLAEDPAGLAVRMAGLLDLETERVTQWLLARCVHESIDQPALAAIAATLAST